jgi:hypothetical protein
MKWLVQERCYRSFPRTPVEVVYLLMIEGKL